MASLSNYYSATYWSSYNFLGSAWLIPVVMLGYLLVIVLDGVLVWHTNKTIAKQTDNHPNDSVGRLHSVDQNDEVDRSQDRPVKSSPSEAGDSS